MTTLVLRQFEGGERGAKGSLPSPAGLLDRFYLRCSPCAALLAPFRLVDRAGLLRKLQRTPPLDGSVLGRNDFRAGCTTRTARVWLSCLPLLYSWLRMG